MTAHYTHARLCDDDVSVPAALIEALDRIGDGLLILDAHWQFRFVNQQAAAYLGLTPDHRPVRPLWETCPHLLGSELEASLRAVMETRQPQECELPAVHSNRWHHYRISPADDGILVAFSDITARKQAEEALRASEEQLALAISASQAMVYDMDPRTGQIHALRGADTLVGSTPDANEMTLQWWDARIHPEDLARCRATLGHTLKQPGPHRLEYRVCTDDGHWRSVEDHATVVCDDAGTPIRIVGTVVDITARKMALQNEERFTALLNHNPSLLFLKDAEGRYVYLNTTYERLFIGSPDWRGKTDFDFWPADSAALFQANDAAVLRSGQMQQFLEDSVDQAGIRHCWLAYKFPFTDAQQQQYLGGIGIDVTDRVRAEEALRESEARYRQVVDETTAIILRVDPQGVIRFANQRALEFFGFTADELVGRHANDTIVPPQETTGRDLTALVQQIAADPDRFHQNANENIRKNGERVWLEWTNSGIYDAEGQLVEFLSVGIDATARKQAEEALQESEARFRGIVETAEEGIATHAADGTIIYVNQRMADMLGYAREEIIGRSSLSFLDEDEQQDVKHARARMQHEGNFSTERRMRRKDGSVLWTISNISPQRDSTGALLGYLAMHTDITARKQTEEALRESEEQFRRAILDAPIPIIMHAEDGEVLQVSRTWTEMTGYALSDVPTLDAWLNRAYGDGADAVRDHMHALFTGDQHAITVEFPISTRDGQVRHWSFSASAPGTLRDGRRFVVGMAVDITERKQYVQALLDHDRAKDELLAVISHELQTPLTSMLGWSTEALLAGDPGLMAQAMQVVHRNAVRQKRLIGDLLDISRLIHHKLTLEPAPLELNEQARQAVENISSQAQERELRLTFTPCPTPLPVHADPARLQQCLDNLLSNSLKFTDAGGTIDVCCWREGDEAVVAVRDSGRGIAPAALPTIFQLFEQVNRDERAGGLGLGLAITQRLVEMHQGRIHAESDGLGHGSRFVITLPLAPADRDATIAAGCAPCQSCG